MGNDSDCDVGESEQRVTDHGASQNNQGASNEKFMQSL